MTLTVSPNGKPVARIGKSITITGTCAFEVFA